MYEHLSNMENLSLNPEEPNTSRKSICDKIERAEEDQEHTMEKSQCHQQKKRVDDVLGWHEYFMASAFLIAKRSKDPATRVGAVIVNNENKIVGTGYNGMPIGCSDDEFPWGKNTQEELDSKYLYVCHAEMNAILNKNSADTKNCKIYTSLFPCNECAKIIIQAGIREVIYLCDKNMQKPATIASKRMFDSAKISYWQFKPIQRTIVIDMYEGMRKPTVQGLTEKEKHAGISSRIPQKKNQVLPVNYKNA